MYITLKQTNTIDTFIQNQLSEHTRSAYRTDLRQFFDWCGVPIERIQTEHLVRYRNELVTRYSVASVNRKLAAIRALFKHLGLGVAESVRLYPQPENATTIALSDAEVVRMLDSVNTNTPSGVMHHAALSMLLYLGLRSAELRSICMGDISDDAGTMIVKIHGKGMQIRIIPIPDQIRLSLNRYINTRALVYAGPLFSATNPKGLEPEPLSRGAIRKIVEKYRKISGINKKISPHSLRATCISNAIENGASLIHVQYLAGWKSPAMIQRYDKRSQILSNSAAYAVNYGGPK